MPEIDYAELCEHLDSLFKADGVPCVGRAKLAIEALMRENVQLTTTIQIERRQFQSLVGLRGPREDWRLPVLKRMQDEADGEDLEPLAEITRQIEDGEYLARHYPDSIGGEVLSHQADGSKDFA